MTSENQFSMTDSHPCELCRQPEREPMYRHEKWVVTWVDDANYPGFCRVIWRDHIKEMTDLSIEDRTLFMRVVWQVEQAVRTVMQPDKINLASLGNMTPHLHWHVIPRYVDDAHFPHPIWSQRQRTPAPQALAARAAKLPVLQTTIIDKMAELVAMAREPDHG